MDAWDACDSTIPPEALKGKKCIAGLDLATVKDIAALVLYFPEEKACLPFFWVPEENARQRSRRDRVPYDVWIKQGLIEATQGGSIDHAVIRRRVNELSEIYNIQKIARDPWNAAQITTELMGDGFEMVDFRQGFASLNAGSKHLEKLILDRSLQHFGNPVLRWMAGNVTVETDAAANIKPSKKKSSEKIDGIVSLVMAIAVAISEAQKISVYESRGVLQV